MSENQITVKSLILDSIENDDAVTKKPVRKKPNVNFEVVVNSAQDFAIQRTSGNRRKLLVILVSQEQYYIKNENTGEIEPLSVKGLQAFWRGFEGTTFPVNNAWCKSIRVKKDGCEAFCSILSKDGFKIAAESGIVQYKGFVSYKLSAFYTDMETATHIYNLEPAHTLYNAIRKLSVSDDELHKYICGGEENKGHISPQNLLAVYVRYGVDKMREFVETLYENGIYGLTDYEMVRLLTIEPPMDETSRRKKINESYKTGYSYYHNNIRPYASNPIEACLNLLKKTESSAIAFDFDSMLHYISFESVNQGFANDMTSFFMNWTDYVLMSFILDNECDDKYPAYLESTHRKLSYQVTGIRNLIQFEEWEKVNENNDVLNQTIGQYVFMLPSTPEDLNAEGAALHHCVASYSYRVLNGKSLIVFMRRVNRPDEPYITLELSTIEESLNSNYTLLQARGNCNRRLTNSEMDVVREYLFALNANGVSHV